MTELFLQLMRPFAMVTFGLLRRFQRRTGILPTWYFFAIAKFIPMTAYELLITRQCSSGREVLLFRRPDDDRYWPGMWHYPGTVVRTGDRGDDVWRRLSIEVGVPIKTSELRLIRTRIGINERGSSVFLIHHLESGDTANFPEGRFFPVTAIPQNTVAECARTIAECLSR